MTTKTRTMLFSQTPRCRVLTVSFLFFAELHRSESMQEKNVKEAKTKCRTIASLLTDAPNPHSKGVLMFKKRRQRAKKYTLVSFGSVDEDRCYDEEDGVFPTSESEFDEEGFSDARSLTNHSDWDTYLDIEKPKGQSTQEQAQQGLSEASGRGAQLFEQQRQKAGKHTLEKVSGQKLEEQPLAAAVLTTHRMGSEEAPAPQRAEKASLSVHLEPVQVSNQLPSPSPAQLQSPSGIFAGGAQVSPSTPSIFNRSARPFTPGFSGQRPVTSSVVFRPSVPKKSSENLSGQRTSVPPFSPGTTVLSTTPTAMQSNGPASASVSLYIPTTPSSAQPTGVGNTAEAKPPSSTARTSTASIYLSAPSKPAAGVVAATSPPSLPLQAQETTASTLYPSPTPQQLSQPTTQPFPAVTQAIPRPASEQFASREQRVAFPAPRTGILQEARRRSNKKPMFKSVEEKKKNSPNPELLSLVQNLDEKPKGDHHGAGFESGPEEDVLSLGAEACNFMQASARKFKTPPPVAPKPQPGGLVNGSSPTPDMPPLKGKGAELFAKRQSRMDKFVVEAAPTSVAKPRTPSPAPSLPSSWKYSPNIRAPPPIAYNPLHSPFYPLAASKSQGSKAESKVKKPPSQKSGIQAIDFLRHQPYQLNPAMFCFGDAPSSGGGAQSSTAQAGQQSSSPFTPAKQAPTKTARTYEIRRFSTPAPMPTSSSLAPTVLAPRSATTLDEPLWRTEMTSTSTPVISGPFQVAAPQYQSSPELNEAGSVASPSRPASSSSFQVARPRFSAAQTGMQAHVWRPRSSQH